MIEPKLVDPVELEVGEDAEGVALSSRTACSGAFCASKQHQSIMSSIQRHIGGAIHQPGAGVFPHLLRTAKSFLQAVFNAARAPNSAVQQRGSLRDSMDCARGDVEKRVFLTFRERFSSLLQASAATRRGRGAQQPFTFPSPAVRFFGGGDLSA